MWNSIRWNRPKVISVISNIILSTAFVDACSPTAPSVTQVLPGITKTIRIMPALTGLRVGEAQQFVVVELPDGKTVDSTLIVWTVDRSDVCVVANDGSVTALRRGVAQLSASDGTTTASLMLTV